MPIASRKFKNAVKEGREGSEPEALRGTYTAPATLERGPPEALGLCKCPLDF